MGWNDHVEFVEIECLDCGEADTWEFWDDVAMQRYAGDNKHLGEFLGHSDKKANRCPHCGSAKGREYDDE